MLFKPALCCCVIALSVAFSANAQTERKPAARKEMDVDLPDETEETTIIDAGEWQLETSVLHNRYNDGPSSTIGQLMLRHGVSERLEVRLLVEDGRQRDRYMEETVQSTYPLAASAKFVVLKDQKILPDITLVGYLKLPLTGRSRDQNAYWSPILLAAFQHQWGGDRWKLEYNGGAQQEAYSAAWVGLANASLHYKIVESVEVFGEYFAQFQPGEDPQHNVGGGIAWQCGAHVEIYAAAGSSIDTDRWNRFANAGIAFRY